MEEIAKTVALTLSVVVELLGAIITAVAIVQFLVGYIAKLFRRKQYLHNAMLRVKFGSSLAIVLELLLAADILRTAVAPSWDEIGKLAAIAAIRTTLNYFLERELNVMEQRIEKHEDIVDG